MWDLTVLVPDNCLSFYFSLHDPQVNVTRLTEVQPPICLSCFHNRKVEKNLNKNFNVKFQSLDHDVKVTDVGYDGTAQNFRPVSNIRQSINKIQLKLQKISTSKNFNQKLKLKISKSRQSIN